MIFIAGISPRLKQLGFAGGICSTCKASGRLHIVKQSQCVSLFFIPLIPFGGEYIATCGSCASVFALRKEAGKRFEREPERPLSSHDFEVIKNNHCMRCSRCGHRAEPGFVYCPGCGSRL
ncbi:MAG: zinc ribbon domain-containing protein [Oscillospiraceae bacterium]|nr:zinc ribbon domain-containing protein [Oscillospiraceae bacterium]